MAQNGTETDPTTIVENLKTLTDIEGDLADTAIAVAAIDEGTEKETSGDGVVPVAAVSSGPEASASADASSGNGNVGQHENQGDRETLTTAEAMESVLEGTIPPKPETDAGSGAAALNVDGGQIEPVHVASAESGPTSVVNGAVDAQISQSMEHSSSGAPNPSSSSVIDTTTDASALQHSIQQPDPSAVEAMEAIDAVAVDVNVPILPSGVAAATQPDSPESSLPAAQQESQVPPDAASTTAPGVTGDSMPSKLPDSSAPPPASFIAGTAQPVDALPQSESTMVPDTTSFTAPGVASQVDTQSFSTSQYSTDKPTAEDAAQLPSQTPFQSLEAPQLDVDLPGGLTSTSASVAGRPDLIRLWKQEPKNSRTLLELFTFSVQKTEIQDARAWYHALSEIEPYAVQPLLALINLELALSNFAEVESLFGRALKGGEGGAITAAADVSIWKAYLHYIRRQNPITEGAANIEQVRGTISKAYEFALEQCGTDRESGEIWQEYVNFVSEPTPKNTWETQQQMDTLRKVYQRAVCIPLNNVEALWKAYDAFESGLNKLTAKKFLAERSPAYMTARTALRELRTLTEGLPHPPLPPMPTFTDNDRATVNGWKAYLRWEEGNPLVIEDQSVLQGRIRYAIRQCLGEMRHFPELWHFAANWHLQAGRKDEAAEVLDAAVQACPTSYLLTFALAELEEERGNFSRCHDIFESLLKKLNPEIDDLKVVVAAEVDRARGPEINRSSGDDISMNGDDGLAEVTRLIDEREARGKLVAERRGKDVMDLAVAASIVWIMYMRFARRAEGLKAARGVFGKARKSPHVTWHTFEASAMIEYHSNKDSAVAIRIFELGFKLFSEDVEYVVRYLQFLLSINDDSNARALFERSASKITAEKARPLWDTWARYEYMYGDLSGVHKLDARFAEVFPHDSPLKRFAQRYIYNGIDQIALRDLGFGKRASAPPPAPPALPQDPSLAPSLPHSIPSNPMSNHPSPPLKRPFPDRDNRSPQRGGGGGRNRNQGSHDRSQSPSAKRYRPSGPPRGTASPPPRRYPLPERDRDRVPSGSGPVVDRYGRDDRTPLPPPPGYGHGPPPPPHARGSLPPQGGAPPPPLSNMGPPRGTPPGPGGTGPSPRDRYDRSGLTRPLSWFIESLPSVRSFDGPIFRADDIMHLFGSISRDGVGLPLGPPQPPQGIPDPRYGGPPPPRGRY